MKKADESNQANPETWMLTLTAPSAARFFDVKTVEITNSAESSHPVVAVRVFDQWYTSKAGDGSEQRYIGGLSVQGAGRYNSVDNAVSDLSGELASFLHVMALLANAAVGEPANVYAFRPPTEPGATGAITYQIDVVKQAIATTLRKVHVEDFAKLWAAINDHPKKDRVYRAMAHFRMALNHLDRLNRVLAAESLWMCVENLYDVVLHRLRAEGGFSQDGPGAEALAATMGFAAPADTFKVSRVDALRALLGKPVPRPKTKSYEHTNKMREQIRREVIFAGDKTIYRDLLRMSDGFEHGYEDFSKIQKRSKVADKAFGLVRRAVLQELGIDETSRMLSADVDEPLGLWGPSVQLSGTYTDSEYVAPPVVGKLDPTAPWPVRPDLSLDVFIDRLVDDPAGTRDIQITAGAVHVGKKSQSVTTDSPSLAMPTAAGIKTERSHTTLKVNGEIIQDQDLPVGDDDDASP